MTLKFHANIKPLMVGQGLLKGFDATAAITVYSGAQPTPAEVVANWTSTYSNGAACLAHFMGGVWAQPMSGQLLQLKEDATTLLLPAAMPLHSGAGTWAILWAQNVTAAQLAALTPPIDKFIVVPVSLMPNSGVVRFNDVTFTVGTSKTINDCSIGSN